MATKFITLENLQRFLAKLAETGNAGTATKLATPRTVSITGDVTASGNFDGSANLPLAATLANSGVPAGTYKSVTVNAKGLVTAGTNPATLSAAGITDAYTKTEVDAKVSGLAAASDAMVFKGTLGTSGTVTVLPASHKVGDTYRIITAGTYAGVVCEIGDMVICITTGTTANDAHWSVIQTNVDGAVIGPASATASAIALFNGTTGKSLSNSSKTIVTTITGSANVPTDSAVKTFVEGKGYMLAADMVAVTEAEINALFA